MSLFLNHILIPLVLLAAETDIPLKEGPARGTNVFYSNFDSACDTNFDAWPDDWTRRPGPGHPSYVKIQILPILTPAGGQCLKVDLDGGGAAVFTPPILVSPMHSYMLEGLLRTEGLKHDSAYYSLIFLDADKRPLVTFESEKVVESQGWKKVCFGPIAPPSRETKLAVIGLQVEPGDFEDLNGAVEFADIRLSRLPRLELRTNQPYNLFLNPAKVEVTCMASGFADKHAEVNFKLFDPLGACLANDTFECNAKPGNTNDDPRPSAPDAAAENVSSVSWEPPISGPGFYRVRGVAGTGLGGSKQRTYPGSD